LPVFIAFVAGDIDQDLHAGDFADGLEDVDRAAGVRAEGQFRIPVGKTDEGQATRIMNLKSSENSSVFLFKTL
jgi:hypothetical protein